MQQIFRQNYAICDIQAAVCAVWGVSRHELTGPSRRRKRAFPRIMAAALCREFTARSYPEIGRLFGGRHHTTIISACRRDRRLCAESAHWLAKRDAVKAALPAVVQARLAAGNKRRLEPLVSEHRA